MSETQSYTHDYSIESIHPYSIDTPEIITKTNRELTRNATLLVRTIELLRKDESKITDMNYKLERITNAILNNLLLFKTQQKLYKNEYNLICNLKIFPTSV